MSSYSRLMLQFAAATGIAAMLSVAAPAMAAESAANSNVPAVTTKTAPSVTERHAPRRARFAASHYRRGYERISPTRGNLECYSVWCGRQFVLMIGIGY